jgi:predicted TIM-barrel fold metal-dependent hydrolase
MTAFGTERVMWASDYTRCLPVATYAEDLYYLLHSGELSLSERKAVLGGTARQLLGWPRPA